MRKILLPLLLILGGCQKYELSVSEQSIDERYLSSTYIGTPDPRKEHPPTGQKLIIDWSIPSDILAQNPCLALHLIYWDYTEETLYYPVYYQRGYQVYSLLDCDYEKKQGIITYKAEIFTDQGDVYREWKHQLWVPLIHLESDQVPNPDNTQETPES